MFLLRFNAFFLFFCFTKITHKQLNRQSWFSSQPITPVRLQRQTGQDRKAAAATAAATAAGLTHNRRCGQGNGERNSTSRSSASVLHQQLDRELSNELFRQTETRTCCSELESADSQVSATWPLEARRESSHRRLPSACRARLNEARSRCCLGFALNHMSEALRGCRTFSQ